MTLTELATLNADVRNAAEVLARIVSLQRETLVELDMLADETARATVAILTERNEQMRALLGDVNP